MLMCLPGIWARMQNTLPKEKNVAKTHSQFILIRSILLSGFRSLSSFISDREKMPRRFTNRNLLPACLHSHSFFLPLGDFAPIWLRYATERKKERSISRFGVVLPPSLYRPYFSKTDFLSHCVWRLLTLPLTSNMEGAKFLSSSGSSAELLRKVSDMLRSSESG